MLKPVNPQISLPEQEEEIIKFWKENKIFEKSVESRSEDKTWTFLDGPPFVTGLPHYGHLLTSIAKDLFPRFWTMKGYRVRRVWGWDGHGLPIENKVETKLELKSKKDIEEKVGIKKFIDECKGYVDQISGEWEWYIDHIGRWVDFQNAYKTWDTPYMESVMWVFKELYEKGFIYKGLRVSLYCPHCATPISNFEVAMDADNHKVVPDAATTYKYQLEGEDNTYILAWSTTPWNKIVTPALAVNPSFDYVKVEQNGEKYILAKSTVKTLGEQSTYKIIEEIKGKDLIGKKYIPHYDYYKDKIKEGEKAFVVTGGDFVTADEGTGVVTIAVYGEEDLKVMEENNIHKEMHVDDEGNILPEVPLFGGMYYLKANKAVNSDLAERHLIYKDELVDHNVPLCWRCHTRLYYAPIDAWFVNVQSLKNEMKQTNESVNWYPEHFKHGRFEKSLESAPDWNISRNRYWGSPVPVWECSCGERFVPGSIKELEEASGQKINDLHKPEIDQVFITCKKCGQKVKRVPEVLDSWIEAGSASFGERHYPFESSVKLDSFYPPDFIVEYTGQIRAWFYVLHVISNALYNKIAFKNVMVTGVILGTDGRKMSKNYGNYPDPKELIQKYGADALRLYLMSSPVIRGEDAIISEESYRNQVRGVLLLLWNTYNFFVSYALVDDWHAEHAGGLSNDHIPVLDKWILSLLNNLIKSVTVDLEGYDTVSAVNHVQEFVDSLSTWYIRRSRDRVGASVEEKNDKNSFYSTTYVVLTTLTKVMAPLTPFISEAIFKNLTGRLSVHLEQWPEAVESIIDIKLEEEMIHAQNLASVLNAFRKQAGVKVKIPFKKLSYKGPVELSAQILEIVRGEVNAEELLYEGMSEEFEATGDTSQANQNVEAGMARDIVRKIQQERKKLGTTLSQKVNVTLSSWPEQYEDEIKRKALVSELIKGEEFTVVIA